MDSLEAWLEFRKGEIPTPSRAPKVCPSCEQARDDIDLIGENPETGEEIWECKECTAREDMAAHKAQGLPVDCLVMFQTNRTLYGTLLTDGRVMVDDTAYQPTAYTKV